MADLFLSPQEILTMTQENKHLGIFLFFILFLFYHENVYCVYSLESPHLGNSNVYTEQSLFVTSSKRHP